ncbi:MAG TPA: SHOCT domain-containing protein [Gemmataceae bacterium]|nr:SHOCT domain-containing protein [Gemmataceae bacterium]
MAVVWVAAGFLAPIAQNIVRDPRFLWTTLALAGALFLGALVILWVDRWRKQPVEDRLTPSDQLAQFRSLYERGELSAEEFERLRAHLGGQLRKELEAAPEAPPARPNGPPRDGIQPPGAT